MSEQVNHPRHYTQGIECIDYIESHNMGFARGNAVKYLTRAGLKGNELEDLKKARWYVDHEILRLGGKNDEIETPEDIDDIVAHMEVIVEETRDNLKKCLLDVAKCNTTVKAIDIAWQGLHRAIDNMDYLYSIAERIDE